MTWSGGWLRATSITICSTTTWSNIPPTPTIPRTITGRRTMMPGATAAVRTTGRPSESRSYSVVLIAVTTTTRTSTPIIRSTTRPYTIPITTRRPTIPTTSIRRHTITTTTATIPRAVAGMDRTATGIPTPPTVWGGALAAIATAVPTFER